MNEPDRIERNSRKLLEVDIRYRGAFAATLQQLERWNWRPRIQEAGRSDERQEALWLAKFTKVRRGGKHNRLLADQFASHAADILDDDSPLSENARWYADLAVAAQITGGAPAQIQWAIIRQLPIAWAP